MIDRVWCWALLVAVSLPFWGNPQSVYSEEALTIVATVSAEKRDDELRDQLVFAIKQIPGVDASAKFNVTTHPLTAREYAALEILFDDIASGAMTARYNESNLGLTLSNSQNWVFEDHSKDSAGWDAIKVRYRVKGTEVQEKQFDVGSASDEVPFQAKSLSEFVFSPETDWELREFSLRRTGETEFSPWSEFPRRDRHLIVRIQTDADVSFSKLYETLLTSDKVGNAIKDIRRPKSATLVLANFEYIFPDEGITVDTTKNTATLSATPLVGVGRCKRVWMLFPLTAEEKDQALEDLEEKGLLGNVVQFANALSKGVYNSDGKEEKYETYPRNFLADGQSMLVPTDPPKWYELVPVNANGQPSSGDDLDKYERTFQIVNVPEWKSRYQNATGETWRILAYEFEGTGGLSTMIKVRRTGEDGEEEVALDSAVPGWPLGVKNLKP